MMAAFCLSFCDVKKTSQNGHFNVSCIPFQLYDVSHWSPWIPHHTWPVSCCLESDWTNSHTSLSADVLTPKQDYRGLVSKTRCLLWKFLQFLSFSALFGIDPNTVRVIFFFSSNGQDDGCREMSRSWLCDNTPLVPVLLHLMSYVVSTNTLLPVADALCSFSRGTLSEDFLLCKSESVYLLFLKCPYKGWKVGGSGFHAGLECQSSESGVSYVWWLHSPLRPGQGPRTMSKSTVMDKEWQATIQWLN